jgi:hypothetical protein
MRGQMSREMSIGAPVDIEGEFATTLHPAGELT